jgi:hypothetical protein
LQVAPLLGQGYVLNRDMVFVPKLPLTDTLLGVTGVPRSVPSDLVVALLSRIVPGQVVQDLVLLFVIAVGGWGAGRLVSRSMPGAVAAAALYSWNPYLTEHLLLGQWAILLGYAALPWVAAAAIDYRSGERTAVARLVIWLAVAAVGGASSEFLAALVTLPILSWPTDGVRAAAQRVTVTLVGLLLLGLPWLIPALTNPGGTPADQIGATVFASRSDTPFGPLGSLLSLGGVWNTTAVPPGRGHWYAALAALGVTAMAVWGLVLLYRSRGAATSGGLAIGGAIGLALAIWSHVPGLSHGLHWLSSHSQAFDLLRDGQRSLAPFVLLVAVGWGWAVAELAAETRRTAVLAAVPMLILPSAAWAVSGQLVAVDWPSDWATIAGASRDLPPGPVLVLPWASVRAYPWNGNRAVADPASRWLPRRVVGDTRLLVRASDGKIVATPQEDPLARAISTAAEGSGPLTDLLIHQGYAGVLVESDVSVGSKEDSRLPGPARLVASTPTLALYSLTGAKPVKIRTGSVPATVVGDALALLTVTIAGTICAVSAVHRRRSV